MATLKEQVTLLTQQIQALQNQLCLTPKEATPGFEPGTIQVYTGVNHYTI